MNPVLTDVAVGPARATARPNTNETLISVLVQVAGRPEPLAAFYEELTAVLSDSYALEFVFVLEPRFDGLATELLELAARGAPIRVIRLGQRLGQAALLRAGLAHCRGSILLTLPARRRVETAALRKLVQAVEAGVDVAVARRWPRHDSWLHRTQARTFHALAGRLLGAASARINDVNSGVMVIRRSLLSEIPLYGDFARFLPLVAQRDGYVVEEIIAPQPVSDQRAALRSPGGYLRNVLDLLGFAFLMRFNEKPLRFFGVIGSAAVVPGVLILLALVVQRLTGTGIADRPLLLLGVLLIVVGIQMIALGLIGEIIVHLHASERRGYRIQTEPATAGLRSPSLEDATG